MRQLLHIFKHNSTTIAHIQFDISLSSCPASTRSYLLPFSHTLSQFVSPTVMCSSPMEDSHNTSCTYSSKSVNTSRVSANLRCFHPFKNRRAHHSSFIHLSCFSETASRGKQQRPVCLQTYMRTIPNSSYHSPRPLFPPQSPTYSRL